MPAFDYKLYLDVARALMGTNEEAYWRSSISTSYYGVYHRTRRTLGISSKTYIKHDELEARLRNEGELNDNISLAFQLGKLKQMRVTADYYAWNIVDKVNTNLYWAKVDRYLKMLKASEDARI